MQRFVPGTNRCKSVGKQFERLVEIMAELRGPDGCPWDRKQTYKDISPYMLEEVHEVMESIDRGDMEDLKEELGDLLLHIVFHAEMARADGHFDIADVVDGICEKLIHRHPHVFGDTEVKDADHVIERWEQIKKAEKGGKSVLAGVPPELPALLKAFRLGEKAGRVGFDWTDADGILEKLQEEVTELNEARKKRNVAEIEHEYGDILFTLANIGRFFKINPEDALRKSTNRFIKRFKLMEKAADQSGLKLLDLDLEKWDEMWEEAKTKIQNPKTKISSKT